jgi:hypothetical protein
MTVNATIMSAPRYDVHGSTSLNIVSSNKLNLDYKCIKRTKDEGKDNVQIPHQRPRSYQMKLECQMQSMRTGRSKLKTAIQQDLSEKGQESNAH